MARLLLHDINSTVISVQVSFNFSSQNDLLYLSIFVSKNLTIIGSEDLVNANLISIIYHWRSAGFISKLIME